MWRKYVAPNGSLNAMHAAMPGSHAVGLGQLALQISGG